MKLKDLFRRRRDEACITTPQNQWPHLPHFHISPPLTHNVNIKEMDLISICLIDTTASLPDSIDPPNNYPQDNADPKSSSESPVLAPMTSLENLSFSDVLSCSTKLYDAKQDTTAQSFSTLTVDAANVQIFHHPAKIRVVKHNSTRPTSFSANILTTENGTDSKVFVKPKDCSEVTFRAEFNALLNHHNQVVEKHKQEIENLQNLLSQQKQLNKQLIVALNGSKTPKVNHKYRQSFIPIAITKPHEDHQQSPPTLLDLYHTNTQNEVLLPPAHLSESGSRKLSATNNDPISQSNQILDPAIENCIPIKDSISTSSSSNSLSETNDIFTINSKRDHSGNDELSMAENCGGSRSTTPDSFHWQSKF